ncbi:unnamed protein product [Cylindrotheca closterium]|uniref:Telomerase reverse transcriptase n=1 Tax=Cylindrotheca closterium TaxID=2856 RepID=A0AAD2JPB7_9STRA|nr:unnamed protein product [Cylindrotheca closterium]
MKNSRKRRRDKQHKALPSNHNDKALFSTIEALLPPEQEILLLDQFIAKYAPNLKVDECTLKRFPTLVLAPLNSIVVSPSLRKVECWEPLPGLVDDVVWCLVQRRDKWKRLSCDARKRKADESLSSSTRVKKRRKLSDQMAPDGHDQEIQIESGRNVLAQGYAAESVEDLASFSNRHNHLFQPMPVTITPLMRPGVACFQPNDKVSLCKSSITFQQLHGSLGDELLRTILLHTRLFLPLSELQSQQPADQARNDCKHQEENFLMVCGPPLSQWEGKAAIKATSADDRNRPSFKRPRWIQQWVPMDDNHHHPNGTLSRHSLYYSSFYIPKIGLPKSHVLQLQTQSSPTQNGATILLRRMVMSDSSKQGGKKTTQDKRRWIRVRHYGVDLCHQILLGHSKCDYARLLNRYCAIPDTATAISTKSNPAIPAGQDDLITLAHSHATNESVASFLVSVLKAVFPAKFWGSGGNFDSVVESVRHFVMLRRYEKLANKRLMHGIRITKMPWLVGNKRAGTSWTKADHQVVTSLALGVLRWIFRGFLIPLLRACFHVTESEFAGKQLLYYRKPVWSIFRSLSMKKLLRKQFFQLSIARTRQLLVQQRMGFSQLRLLPKATGVRPISQLSRSPVFPFSMNCKPVMRGDLGRRSLPGSQEEYFSDLQKGSMKLLATNKILSEAFHILKYECSQLARPFGFGLASLSDFYPLYRNFILGLKKPRKNLMLRFASVDIEKCFDSINQDHLLKLLNELISRDRYFIQQFNQFCLNKNEGKLETKVRKIVDPNHQDCQSISKSLKNVIFDSRNRNVMSRIRVMELLTEHLCSNLVAANGRYGKRALLQSGGIPQGSTLSTLLCNLYYGSVEDSLFQGMQNSASLITRQVDDFLCISTESDFIHEFVDRMDKGNEALGVKVNKGKTLVSHLAEARMTHSIFGDSLFPWCGMLFDTMTGEVSMDYTRFHGGIARDSLTVRREGNEGSGLRSKVKSFILPRCIPILFDSAINSFEKVVANFYQTMLYGAIKMAEYLRSSQLMQSSNPEFLLKLIDDAADYALSEIKTNLKRQQQSGRSCNFALKKKTVCWITWRGFHDIFSLLQEFHEFSTLINAQLAYKTPCPRLDIILEKAYERFDVSNMISF